ncbi:unnamed protein product [Brachionus calyciflorus]|uniref:Uncharacterized protein n=1 Tax=Brachionus calyciflorus TaxID=104777 RepID=A0A814GIE6_9BILA|nr:unnamed protein product [Brachionus calyciflorus]
MKKLSLVIISVFSIINFAQLVFGSERCSYYPNYYNSYSFSQYTPYYTTCTYRCCSTLFPTTIASACCSSSNSIVSYSSSSSTESSSSIVWWWVAAPVLGFVFCCCLPCIIIGVSIYCCTKSSKKKTRVIAPVNPTPINTIRADVVVQLPDQNQNKNNFPPSYNYNQQAGQPDLTLPPYPSNNAPIFNNNNNDPIMPVLPNSTVGSTGPANPAYTLY